MFYFDLMSILHMSYCFVFNVKMIVLISREKHHLDDLIFALISLLDLFLYTNLVFALSDWKNFLFSIFCLKKSNNQQSFTKYCSLRLRKFKFNLASSVGFFIGFLFRLEKNEHAGSMKKRWEFNLLKIIYVQILIMIKTGSIWMRLSSLFRKFKRNQDVKKSKLDVSKTYCIFH